MNDDDAEAQETQGTVVSSGLFPEPAADDRTDPAEAADQDEVSDPEDEEDEDDQEDEERDDDTDPGYGRVEADRGDDDEVVDPDAVIIDQADDPAADNEAPEMVAGFARTPVASPASATADDTPGADAVPEADVIAEAARPGVPRDADVPAMSGVAGDPDQLHAQWSAIQSSFVDDPRASVAAAAELVTEAIAALVASVQERERGLRDQWERDSADTEDLRNTLRGYRGLLDQLAAR